MDNKSENQLSLRTVRMRNGARRKLRRFTMFLASAPAAIGGQAVLEGVMMRSPNHWAVALRRANGEIIEIHRKHSTFASRHRWARIPIIRGVIALGDSLSIGFRALQVSAHYAAEWYEEDDASGEAHVYSSPEKLDPSVEIGDDQPGLKSEVQDSPRGSGETSPDPDAISTWQIVTAFVLAFGFSILLFKVMPAVVTKVAIVDAKSGWFVLAEAAVRIGVFIGYLALIGLMPDMKRVFQYHSAEHKSINAWEAGASLDPTTVNGFSRIHVRCGTAFMLWVFVVAIAVFAVFGHYFQPGLLGLVLSRILLIPLIAGMSFEIIRFAGKHANNGLIRGVLAPGLWMQRLTTRECQPEHCEVAIASLRVVLDNEYPGETLDEQHIDSTSDEDGPMRVLA